MKWTTPDRRVIDVITVRFPGGVGTDRPGIAGTQFRVRDIHGHYLGTAKTVAKLSALGIDLADLQEIS